MVPNKTILSLALCTVATQLSADNHRPNFLWLTFEDTSPIFIGCYGNKSAITPVMDSLASDGIRYENAFSIGIVSSLSRFYLMTGCRPGRYGAGNHRSLYPVPEFIHGFSEYLRESGYYTNNNSNTDFNHRDHREMAKASWDDCSGKASWRDRKPGQPFFSFIFLFSDHGDGIPRGKGSALGSGYQIPFILWVPEMYEDLIPHDRDSVSDELVSFKDFGATVLHLAGVEIPAYNEGVPLLPQRGGKKPYIYGACDAVDSNTELSRSVIDGQYIYTRVFTPYQHWVRWISYYDHADIQKVMRRELDDHKLSALQQEIMSPCAAEYLYDLKNDKWETRNLADDHAYRKKIKEMRTALMKHLIQTRDANFIPEYYLDRMSGTTTSSRPRKSSA